MPSSTPALDELVCFALYSASRLMGQTYRSLLAEWDLTYPQYLVLVVLWRSDGAGVGEIGAQLGLDSGTLSPLLKRMEVRGLVRRTRSATDERTVAVTLTDRGRALREELSGIPACLARETGMSASEAAETLTLLHDLTARLSKADAEAAAV
jgi:DNA-binding MarR family transcriptional regulator